MVRKTVKANKSGVRRTPLAAALGVHGWAPLDPVLLAALATESPVLLVGAHGTAKSLLVERVAGALGQEFRHYNAALLNYDDLVGIPLPDDGGSLRFVHTPGALWDAEFVFFDEISRCRADLANKLFPIVHERKVLGLPLARLRHRWAAMNPPAGEDDEPGDGRAASYLGSEPLDPALADRFPFVVTVPGWTDLDAGQRAAVVLGRGDGPREAAAEPLADLVARCAEQVPVVAAGLEEFGPAYVLALADQLGQASLPPSPRRCRMLFRSFAAVHAARLALGETPCLLEDSAWLAVRTGLPQSAETPPPSLATLLGLHRQAWEIASTAQDSPWRKVLEEPDPLRRVKLAHALGLPDADVARLVTRALAEQPHDAARVAAATTMFLAFPPRGTSRRRRGSRSPGCPRGCSRRGGSARRSRRARSSSRGARSASTSPASTRPRRPRRCCATTCWAVSRTCGAGRTGAPPRSGSSRSRRSSATRPEAGR